MNNCIPQKEIYSSGHKIRKIKKFNTRAYKPFYRSNNPIYRIEFRNKK